MGNSDCTASCLTSDLHARLGSNSKAATLAQSYYYTKVGFVQPFFSPVYNFILMQVSCKKEQILSIWMKGIKLTFLFLFKTNVAGFANACVAERGEASLFLDSMT